MNFIYSRLLNVENLRCWILPARHREPELAQARRAGILDAGFWILDGETHFSLIQYPASPTRTDPLQRSP